MSEKRSGSKGGHLPRKHLSRSPKPKLDRAKIDQPTGIPDDAPPLWHRLPLDHKLPMFPGSSEHVQLSRRNIVNPLHVSDPGSDFDLGDPYNHHCSLPAYHPLHDPNAKQFLQCTRHYQVIKQQGLLTPSDGVRCSLKEFNEYRLYLHRLKALQNNQQFLRELKDIKKKKAQEERDRKEIIIRKKEGGESDARARRIRERKEMINEQYREKSQQKLAVEEVRVRDRLQERSQERAEKEGQKCLQWQQRHFRAIGKQKLDIWHKKKQSEQMLEDERERERRMEMLREEKRKTKHEISECRWLERCRRQHQQIQNASDATERDSRILSSQPTDKEKERTLLEKYGAETAGDFYPDPMGAATGYTEDNPKHRKDTVDKSPSLLTTENARLNEYTNFLNEEVQKNVEFRPRSSYGSGLHCNSDETFANPEFPVEDPLSSTHFKKSENEQRKLNDVSLLSEESCRHGDKDVADNVWHAILEKVVDNAQMRMQHAFVSHSSGRLAMGEVDETLVSQVAEEVGQRVLDAVTAQLMTILTESATIPAPEVLDSLVSHMNDLIIDLSWDLLLPFLQQCDKMMGRLLWRETMMRAACELGRQAMLAVVVWMCERKVAPSESSSSVAFVCTCILAAVVSKAAYSDIMQELLDPRCRTRVKSLMHSGLLLTDEVMNLAEHQLWYHLNTNENKIPSATDSRQIACRVAQAILIQADNHAHLHYSDPQSKEMVSDCVLDSVICNLQARLLAGYISAANSLNQPMVTCEGDSMPRTGGICPEEPNTLLKKKLEETEETAAEMCASAIKLTFSSLQCDKSSETYEEYCSQFNAPIDSPTCEPLDEVLFRAAVDEIRQCTAACLKRGEIPISGSGMRAIHSLARQIAMQGVAHLRIEALTHPQALLTFTSGRTLLNVVRWRVKKKSYVLERQILRSLADADVRKAQQLLEWVLQVEHLNVFCHELKHLLDKDRKCVTRRQTKALFVNNLALHAILSRERISVIRLVTGNIEDNVQKALSNNLFPTRRLADAIQNYTFSVVLPKAVGEMELQLNNLLAISSNQNSGPKLDENVESAQIYATAMPKSENEKDERLDDDSRHGSDYPEPFQKSEVITNSNLPCCEAKHFHTHTSKKYSMLHLQNLINLIMNCLFRVTDKEVRKLIAEHSSSQVLKSTMRKKLDIMAGSVVEQTISATKTELLTSGSDLMQLWESPVLETALEGTVKLIKEMKTFEVEGTDKHVSSMAMNGIKLLCESRGREQLQHQETRLNQVIQSDNGLRSNRNPKQLRTFPTSTATNNQTRENLIPLLLEIILNGALSSEIFSNPDVAAIVLARCECFVEKLIEEIVKISMLAKECAASDSLADRVLSRLLKSIIRGALNSSIFLLEGTPPKVIARSENLIHNIIDSILHVHSICSMPQPGENCFDIVRITERTARKLIKTALSTKPFKISVCQSVVARSQQTVQRILEKFAVYKCNSERIMNMTFPYDGFRIKNKSLVSSLVSKSMSLLEQGLNTRKDFALHKESGSSFQTSDTSQSSESYSRTCQTESTLSTIEESTDDDVFYDTKHSWSGSTSTSYGNGWRSSSQSFIVGETTTDCSGICFKLSEAVDEATSDDTVSSLPTAMAISEFEDRSSLSYKSRRSCSTEIVKLMDGVISGSKKSNEFKQHIENLPNIIEMSSREIDLLVADITNSVEQYGMGCDVLPCKLSSDESRLELGPSRTASLLHSCIEERTSESSINETFMDEQASSAGVQLAQASSDTIRMIVYRAFNTVMLKPCNKVIKQLMPDLAEFDNGNKKEIETVLEDTFINVMKLSDKDVDLCEENDYLNLKTMCEDFIIDLVERIARESFRCELAFNYANWTTTTFASFIQVMKSIMVDTMLCISSKMELFLPLPATSMTQIVKNTANEIFQETVDDVQYCCCSHLSDTLSQEICTIAADVAKKSVEDVISSLSESSMQIAKWQPSSQSLTHILAKTINLSEMLPKSEEKLLEEISCTTVVNLQRRMSEIIKAEVDDIVHQDMNDLKIKSAQGQIDEVNRILNTITDEDCVQPVDNCVKEKEKLEGANVVNDIIWDDDSSADEEVVVVKAVLGACRSLTRLSAQSRVAGQILDSTTHNATPAQSQHALQIVQDIMLSASEEMINQEKQVNLVKQKVMQRVRRKLRDIIKQERHKLGDRCLATVKENEAVNAYNICKEQVSLKLLPGSENDAVILAHDITHEQSKECKITSGAMRKTDEQQTNNNHERFVNDTTHENLCSNFHENMVEILFSGLIDELEIEVNDREALRLSLYKLQNNPFVLAQGMPGEFSPAFDATSVLVSSITASFLKDVLETMIAVRKLRYKSHYCLPGSKPTYPYLCDAMHHNLLSLRSSPEYLVSHLVMEVQEIALCQSVSNESTVAVEDQLSHIVKNTLQKAKFTNTTSAGENKGYQATEAITMVDSFLEDEITTGRAILHHGSPLRNSTAAMTMDLLSRLQQILNSEVEKIEASPSENVQQKMVATDVTTKSHCITPTILQDNPTLGDFNETTNEQQLNKSITDEVTKCLCDGINELVKVGWKKSTSSLDLKNSEKNIYSNVETLIKQTIDDVVTNLQAQAIPTIEPTFMSKTLYSFQNRKPVDETASVPVVFYTCRTGVDCVQAILSAVRYNISKKYAFNTQKSSQIAINSTTDGLLLKGACVPTESSAFLVSPRHVPAIGAKAIEESQSKSKRHYMPIVTVPHLVDYPAKHIPQFPENANFLPRIVPTPTEHFLHRARKDYPYPWQFSKSTKKMEICVEDPVSLLSVDCTVATTLDVDISDKEIPGPPQHYKDNDSKATGLPAIPGKPTLASPNKTQVSASARNFIHSLCTPLRATVRYPPLKISGPAVGFPSGPTSVPGPVIAPESGPKPESAPKTHSRTTPKEETR